MHYIPLESTDIVKSHLEAILQYNKSIDFTYFKNPYGQDEYSIAFPNDIPVGISISKLPLIRYFNAKVRFVTNTLASSDDISVFLTADNLKEGLHFYTSKKYIYPALEAIREKYSNDSILARKEENELRINCYNQFKERLTSLLRIYSAEHHCQVLIKDSIIDLEEHTYQLNTQFSLNGLPLTFLSTINIIPAKDNQYTVLANLRVGIYSSSKELINLLSSDIKEEVINCYSAEYVFKQIKGIINLLLSKK